MSRGAEGTTEASGHRDSGRAGRPKEAGGRCPGRCPRAKRTESDRRRAKTPINRRKSRLRRRAAPISDMPPATRIDSTAKATDREAEQLQLRFFAVLDGYGRNPPERALWRELVNLALGQVKTLMHCERQVSTEAVHHVALALYMRANEAGIIEGFSVPTLAADCRLDERTIRGAMQVLNRLHVVRSSRTSRRKPALHRMNLGGLDWPAVRARAGASAGTMPGLSAGMVPALKGYVRTGLPLVPADIDQMIYGCGIGTGERIVAAGPDDPASEQQVGMLMQLQRQHRPPGRVDHRGGGA